MDEAQLVKVQGRRVTALEVEFSVLGTPAQQQARSPFYLRAPLPYGRMSPATATAYSAAPRAARRPEGAPP